MNPGKQFEKDFANSMPSGVSYIRIKDVAWGSGAMVASKNDCDCIIYRYPYQFMLEMKSTKGTSISFADNIIRPHQLEKLSKHSKVKGVIAGLVFNFRPNGKHNNDTFFVDIQSFLDFKSTTEKKSINRGDCHRIGYRIEDERKIKHYRYNIEKFLDDITAKENSNENQPDDS